MDPTAPNNTNSANPPLTPDAPSPNPGVSATVIDPNDPLVGQVDPAAASQTGPILPGQYVVAGGENHTAADPVAVPLPDPASSLGQPLPVPTGAAEPLPKPEQNPPPGFPESMQQPMPAPAVQETFPPTPVVPIATEQANPAAPESSAPGVGMPQPDPTPYAPPPANQAGAAVKEGSSMIKKLRFLAIVLGGLVLLGVIGALAWFFFFANQGGSGAKTEIQSDSSLPEPPPLPKRTDGGFSVLPPIPQASSSASEASQSAPPLE